MSEKQDSEQSDPRPESNGAEAARDRPGLGEESAHDRSGEDLYKAADKASRGLKSSDRAFDQEDLRQATIERALDRAASNKSELKIGREIARRFLIDIERRRNKKGATTILTEDGRISVPGEQHHADPDEFVLAAERQRLLFASLDTLTKGEREVAEPYVLSGTELPLSEIAEKIGISLDATKKRWESARIKIKNFLDAHGGAEALFGLPLAVLFELRSNSAEAAGLERPESDVGASAPRGQKPPRRTGRFLIAASILTTGAVAITVVSMVAKQQANRSRTEGERGRPTLSTAAARATSPSERSRPGSRSERGRDV